MSYSDCTPKLPEPHADVYVTHVRQPGEIHPPPPTPLSTSKQPTSHMPLNSTRRLHPHHPTRSHNCARSSDAGRPRAARALLVPQHLILSNGLQLEVRSLTERRKARVHFRGAAIGVGAASTQHGGRHLETELAMPLLLVVHGGEGPRPAVRRSGIVAPTFRLGWRGSLIDG